MFHNYEENLHIFVVEVVILDFLRRLPIWFCCLTKREDWSQGLNMIEHKLNGLQVHNKEHVQICRTKKEKEKHTN